MHSHAKSQSEDEVVDRISMLMGPSKEVVGDLAAQRERLSRLRDEQEEKERQQERQGQQDRQQEDSLQKQLREERLSQQVKQQQQMVGQQDSRTLFTADDRQQLQQQQQDRLRAEMSARAALAKQQQEQQKQQQEAGVQAQQEAAKQRKEPAVKSGQQEEQAAKTKEDEEEAKTREQQEARAQQARQRQQQRQQAAQQAAQQEDAAASALEQAVKEEAGDELHDLQQEDLDAMYDIERALTQQPSVPAIDQTLMKAYMQSGAWPGQRYWDQLLASLSQQQGLQQQQQPQPAVSDLIAELLNDARRTQHAVQWRAQQQQQTQDRQQQMLLQAQHEQMDPGTARKMQLQPQQQQPQQPPFTYSFQKPEQSSRFGVNPADPRFWQEETNFALQLKGWRENMENFCGSKPPEGGCGSRQAQGFYPLWQPTASVFHGNRRFADCDPIAQFDRFDPRTTIGLPLEVRAVSRALDFLNPVSEALPQRDPRLQYLSRVGGGGATGAAGSQPQEEQYDEGSSGVRQALIRSAAGLGLRPQDLGLSSEQQPDLPDDLDVDDEILSAAAGDVYPSEAAMWLRQQQQQEQQQRLQQRLQQQQLRVTPPVAPEVAVGGRHQPKPTATRDSRLDEDGVRSAGLANHDYPVVKKQLTFPKDHWFFGMDDVGKLATFIGASIAVSSLILGFIVWQYR
ncbi:Reticulocyte-binding protein 2-like protein a [Frankliniella fusca]|uniref:Reticulocyte-binding protein 2-like protein a n=1 Tax=Frankliniella fusca TaxID=407009 RepID=A0AAE1HNL8_9NEOP|nr:Reticulocyte-binding protein 2-like protein a [Frankliniella fusca]